MYINFVHFSLAQTNGTWLHVPKEPAQLGFLCRHFSRQWGTWGRLRRQLCVCEMNGHKKKKKRGLVKRRKSHSQTGWKKKTLALTSSPISSSTWSKTWSDSSSSNSPSKMSSIILKMADDLSPLNVVCKKSYLERRAILFWHRGDLLLFFKLLKGSLHLADTHLLVGRCHYLWES